MRLIEYEDIIKSEEKYILVDVRSPREYNISTIPGAINIPLLNDTEYEEVGTIYKQIGRKEATIRAIEIVGPKLKEIYLAFDQLFERDKEFVLFCARGGMRSSSLINFLVNFSLPVIKLNYGYKSYRKTVTTMLPELFDSKQFIVLYGKTGVGKTEILLELANKGCEILDLEGCANHRGSLLGSIGLSKPNSQKMFESLIFDSLRRSKGNIIYCEGESRRIGNVMLPQYMFDKFIKSKGIFIETSIENRIDIIKRDYLKGDIDKKEIINALNKLSKYISDKTIDEYILNIEKDCYDSVIESLITNYYDRSYRFSNESLKDNISYNTIEECIEKIIKVKL